MSAVKESIMSMGERGYIPVSDGDICRWQAAIDGAIPVDNVAIEVRGREVVEVGLLAEEARRLASDQRIDARDRQAISFLLEVAGLDGEGSTVSWWLQRNP